MDADQTIVFVFSDLRKSAKAARIRAPISLILGKNVLYGRRELVEC
jgi:hypothetical protein